MKSKPVLICFGMSTVLLRKTVKSCTFWGWKLGIETFSAIRENWWCVERSSGIGYKNPDEPRSYPFRLCRKKHPGNIHLTLSGHTHGMQLSSTLKYQMVSGTVQISEMGRFIWKWRKNAVCKQRFWSIGLSGKSGCFTRNHTFRTGIIIHLIKTLKWKIREKDISYISNLPINLNCICT